MFKPAFLPCLLACAICLYSSLPARADLLEVPITFDTPFLTGLLKEKVFRGENETLSVWGDSTGCNDLTLSLPNLVVVEGHLHVISDASASTGAVVKSGCIPLINWQGKIDARQEASIAGNQDRIEFRTTNSELLNESGKKAIVSGRIWDLTKSYVHPHLDTLVLDLNPAIKELRNLLPLFLPRHNVSQVQTLIDSLQLGSLEIVPTGVKASLGFEIEAGEIEASQVTSQTLTPTTTAMTEQELAEFTEIWERWDAFLTFIVKVAARNSLDVGQRDRLFETLVDARYTLVNALGDPDPRNTDPVRESFITVWQQLAPIFRSISTNTQGSNALRFLSFIAAADALQAIDELGPITGWDVSIDGLRRLARLLIEDQRVDPLEHIEGVDPEMRRLFDFAPEPELTPEGDEDAATLIPLGWLLPHAHAFSTTRKSYARLNKMAPKRANLATYLPLVRELLSDTVSATLTARALEVQHREMFRFLVLATAWQESCWRQYREKNNELVPVKSSAGAVGMMQVIPFVWRGFYRSNLLANDITYNAAAGSEILHHYLVRYAIRKGENKHQGGHDNLARASYAAYNGGPRHLNRYRKTGTSSSLKAIDAAFWDKFSEVRAGNELGVEKCFL